jgi:hypothetical protein
MDLQLLLSASVGHAAYELTPVLPAVSAIGSALSCAIRNGGGRNDVQQGRDDSADGGVGYRPAEQRGPIHHENCPPTANCDAPA